MRHLTELPQQNASVEGQANHSSRDRGAAAGALDPDIAISFVGSPNGAGGVHLEPGTALHASAEGVGMVTLFWRAIKADFRSASGTQYVALAILVALLIFEWGPGNETVVVTSIARVVDSQPGVGGIPLVGLTGLALVGLIQAISGAVALVGFAMFERTAQAGWTGVQRLRKGEPPADWWQLKVSTRWALAFFVGASAVALVQMVATGKTGFRNHRMVIAQSALLAGVTTGLLSAFIAGTTYVARQFPATEAGANTVIRLASNPLVWIGLFATIGLIGAIRSRFGSDEPGMADDAAGLGSADDPID